MTVNFNLVSAELSNEDHVAVIDSIKSIESKLPFAITLPAEEKQALPGLGPKTMEFVEKAFEYALKNPEMVPQFLDMDEFKKDAALARQLQILMNHMVPLTGKLSDTFALVGSEAYSSARTFYHHVKNASIANVPGASSVAKELGKRFQKAGKRTSDSAGDENSQETEQEEVAEE